MIDCWPLASASRIRVKLAQRRHAEAADDVDVDVDPSDDDAATSDYNYCRFFYNSKSGAIDLVPCEQQQQQQQLVYDDNDDIRILEQEPSYQSYAATLAAMEASDGRDINDDDYCSVRVVDSFHPKDVIGANLSFENIRNDSDSTATIATANINIYCYPKQNMKRKACHRHYMLDPQCCMDFADARLIIHAIQKLSQPRNSKKPSDNTTDAPLLSAPITTSSSNPPIITNTTNPITPLKCLVILNPYSGGGGPESKYGAKNIYNTIVKRMLSESTNVVEFDTLVTRHAGHARERMRRQQIIVEEEEEGKGKKGEEVKKQGQTNNENDDDDNYDPDSSTTLNTDTETKDISHYNAILAMGGDGILFEIFQGIHARSDESAILSEVKFAILPCGTYNGLATSILHWSFCTSSFDGNAENAKADPRDYVEMMFHICKGYTSTLDIARYRVLRPVTAAQEGSSKAVGNAAILSDIVTTASAGSSISSMETNTFHNNVNNKNSLDDDAASKSYLSFLTFAWGLIADCDYESECLRWLGHVRSDIWALYRGILCRKRYRGRFTYLPPQSSSSSSSKCEHAQDVVVLPKLGEPLPEGWVTYDCENFLVFWVCNTTHAAHNMYTCSVAKMNDGLFHVLIVRSSCSRLRLLLMLLHLDSGGHMEYPGLEYVPCVAYQFEPLSDVSYNVLDGEPLEDGTVQACFMPGGAQFFVGEGVGNSTS